ncbi:hypothetical protein N7488_005746 [Penicillium malachiteum]|nr:hypothetical protein N7488_005746 [Penicillium malachiteum]
MYSSRSLRKHLLVGSGSPENLRDLVKDDVAIVLNSEEGVAIALATGIGRPDRNTVIGAASLIMSASFPSHGQLESQSLRRIKKLY